MDDIKLDYDLLRDEWKNFRRLEKKCQDDIQEIKSLCSEFEREKSMYESFTNDHILLGVVSSCELFLKIRQKLQELIYYEEYIYSLCGKKGKLVSILKHIYPSSSNNPYDIIGYYDNWGKEGLEYSFACALFDEDILYQTPYHYENYFHKDIARWSRWNVSNEYVYLRQANKEYKMEISKVSKIVIQIIEKWNRIFNDIMIDYLVCYTIFPEKYKEKVYTPMLKHIHDELLAKFRFKKNQNQYNTEPL